MAILMTGLASAKRWGKRSIYCVIKASAITKMAKQMYQLIFICVSAFGSVRTSFDPRTKPSVFARISDSRSLGRLSRLDSDDRRLAPSQPCCLSSQGRSVTSTWGCDWCGLSTAGVEMSQQHFSHNGRSLVRLHPWSQLTLCQLVLLADFRRIL